MLQEYLINENPQNAHDGGDDVDVAILNWSYFIGIHYLIVIHA